MLPSKVDSFVVSVLGDIIDGAGCFPSQHALNTTRLPDQVMMAETALTRAISTLAEHATTYCAFEVGNHADLSKHSHPEDNIEYLLYSMVREKLEKRVEFLAMGYSPVGVVQVEDTVGILSHKGVKHIETPYQRGKALGDLYEHQADWYLCAHLHHIGVTSQGFWFFRNGSLLDRGERHSASLHLYESPRQLCFVVDGASVVGSFWVDFD
jgi:hypothetical protein